MPARHDEAAASYRQAIALQPSSGVFHSALGSVLKLDLISYGGQAVLIAALSRLGRLDSPSALFVLAATSLVSAAYGFLIAALASLPAAVRLSCVTLPACLTLCFALAPSFLLVLLTFRAALPTSPPTL